MTAFDWLKVAHYVLFLGLLLSLDESITFVEVRALLGQHKKTRHNRPKMGDCDGFSAFTARS